MSTFRLAECVVLDHLLHANSAESVDSTGDRADERGENPERQEDDENGVQPANKTIGSHDLETRPPTR